MTNITVENAQVIFRNFAGAPDKFDSRGTRQFNLRIDEQTANEFRDLGLNVKPLRRLSEDDEQFYHVNVKVNYGSKRPPRVTMIGMVDGEEVSRVELTEDTIRILDGAFITNADLILNLYNWTTPAGATGVKPYLDQAYFTVEMSPLDLKYARTEDDPSV